MNIQLKAFTSLTSAFKVYVVNIIYPKDNHEGQSTGNEFWIIPGTLLPLYAYLRIDYTQTQGKINQKTNDFHEVIIASPYFIPFYRTAPQIRGNSEQCNKNDKGN